jgi:uncharacterized peroxidase-related enzyme
MSIIPTIKPQDATGQVAEIYAQMEQAIGRVPNAFQFYSISPPILENQWQSTGYYFRHPNLGLPLLATIRMLVSQANECDYCIGFNEALLIQRAGFTAEQTAAAKRNPADAPLGDKDKAMLLFVLKATRTPKLVTAADAEALRHLGWTDRDILEAVYHGARNVAVDILFNAFRIDNDF